MASNSTPMPLLNVRSFWRWVSSLPVFVVLLGMAMAGTGALMLRNHNDTDAEAEFQREALRISFEVNQRFNLSTYAQGADTGTVRARRAALVGLLDAPIVIRELLEDWPAVTASRLDFELHQADAQSSLLYASKPHGAHAGMAQSDARVPRFTSSQQVSIAGRDLSLRISSSPEFEAHIDHTTPWLVWFAGALVSVLLGLVLRNRLQRVPMIQALVDLRTAELEQERARLQNVLEMTSDGIHVLDATGLLVDANSAFLAMLGLDQRAIGTLHVSDWAVPGIPGNGHTLMSMILAQTSLVFEAKNKRSDSSIIDVEIRTQSSFMDGQRLLYCASRNITERKQKDTLLAEQTTMLSVILANSTVGVLFVRNAKHVWSNTQISKLFGRTSAELAHQSVGIFFPSQEEYERFYSLAHPSLVTVGHFSAPWKLLYSDGSLVWMKISGKAINSEDLNEGSIWVLEDISEQRHAESLLVIANDELTFQNEEKGKRAEELSASMLLVNAANLAKTRFLSSMSHEIRSPLNAILGFTYLLEQVQLSEDARKMVHQIRTSGRMLLGLISDILDVSKIEAGQMLIEMVPFRLSDVIDNVASILKVAVGPKDIYLSILPAPPGVYTLLGDVLRLEQILVNLGSNAIKFTTFGQVEVSCTLQESHSDRVKLRFCVRDSGIGIAPELHSRVFEAFTQADTSTTRQYGGTGLGLSICRQLVELMGGEIGMSSVPGLGSQFWFTLPLQKVPDSAIAATESRQLDALIVDASEIGAAYASLVATDLGWQVQTVNSSETALTRLLSHQHLKIPDVVLLDWKLKGLDGLATVRLIREQLPPEKCPLLIMMSNQSLARLSKAEGIEQVDAMLEKPVTASSLHHAVLEASRNRGAASSLSMAAPRLTGQALLGIRVLVVDDSELNCEVARRILAGEGAQVSLAGNGQEALDCLQANPFAVDLVLMDLRMPVMGGMEATRLLRLQPEFADLPIVALTADALKSQQDAARAAGMTHFLSKPFDVPSTIALIQRLCRRPAPALHAEAPPAAPTPVTRPSKVAIAPGKSVMDVAKGLEILMDMHTYLDYLQRFVVVYQDAVAVMHTSLDQGDRPGAAALAHKLAGEAANLALPDTRRLAAEAERVLRTGQGPAPALADLAQALALAVAEIDRFCQHGA